MTPEESVQGLQFENVLLKPKEILPGSIVPAVFTDGDATLLDHSTYSFEPARPAIDRLKANGLPLIVTTSKTTAELDHLYDQVGIASPFIFENGGGIVFPKGYLSEDAQASVDAICGADPDRWGGTQIRVEEREGSTLIRLGRSIGEVRDALHAAAQETGVSIEGFGDWVDCPEVMVGHAGFKDDAQGAAIEKANRALTREAQEGFLLTDRGEFEDDSAAEEAMKQAIEARGFTFSRGGRFLQVFGGSDKGMAVRLTTELLKKEFGADIYPVGLGDAQNDVPLLNTCVERGGEGFLVHNPKAKGPVTLSEDSAVQILPSEVAGPAGWNVAVQGVLDGFGYN